MPKRVIRHEVEQPQDQSIKLIPLTQGQNAIVDAWNYDSLILHDWWASWNPKTNSYYAIRKVDGKTFGMHQEILPCERLEIPDHIDGNTLDNRESNIQRVSYSHNKIKARVNKNNALGLRGIQLQFGRYKFRYNLKLLFSSKNLEEVIAFRDDFFSKLMQEHSIKHQSLEHLYSYSAPNPDPQESSSMALHRRLECMNYPPLERQEIQE